MGVRGLTTYIANHHKKYLKKFKLHSCYVIIDGNSLACQLFVKYASRAHCAFGGDYDRYANQIREFFIILKRCDVKAIIIFDGGYEQRKVKTVISRMSERIAAMRHVKPCSQDSAIIFPFFLRIVFKQVLKEMGIPFVQCDFEADQEIAALAHKYNCPVLSYDSDFYIFDVSYIPIPLIELEAAPLNFGIGQASEKFCINCKIYKIDFFLNSFGGLDKNMLPLLASLLGNDYVKISAFKKFYSQLKIPKGKSNQLQRKIARVIEWLRNETFESAVEKILGRMRRVKHRYVSRNLMRVVNAYTNLNVTIESYLPEEFTSNVQVINPEEIKKIDCSNLDVAFKDSIGEDVDVEMEEVVSDATEDSLSSESEDDAEDSFDQMSSNKVEGGDQIDVEMTEQINSVEETVSKVIVKFPDWLLESARRGNIESCVSDILTLGTYFALPQIEDPLFRTSHFTSVSLIKTICKLLVGDNFQEISLWTKNDNCKIQRFLLHFSETQKIIDLETVPSVTVEKRKALLLECLHIPPEFHIDSFPSNWKLYACAIIFWIKNTVQPVVTECHLISLCMCMVALGVINNKVGFFRKKITFLKKYGKLQKKVLKKREFGFMEPMEPEGEVSVEITENRGSTAEEISNEKSIEQIMSSVSLEDCIAVYDEFYLFRQLDENLKVDKSLFSLKDIHVFAQFQSCLYHIMILNSLLGFPFEEPAISALYSGTFIYNLSIALKRFKNNGKYLESLLNYSPVIMNLVSAMCTEIAKVAPVVVPLQEVRKNRRRKRKRSTKCEQSDEKKSKDEDIEFEDQQQEVDGDDYYDENNAFSLLSSI